METRQATNDGEHVVKQCRATRPASHGHLRHFTARLGRRTACGSHIHFRAISPLAPAVERPAARTIIFPPLHPSPPPPDRLRLPPPPPPPPPLLAPPAAAAPAAAARPRVPPAAA